MIPTEIPAAMRPYSMAVAPELFFQETQDKLMHSESPVLLSPSRNTNERGRQPGRRRSFTQTGGRADYCSALATLLNVPFTAVPVACTATMIATAIPAAIRPYSIAVAPELSFKKRRTSLCILESPVLLSKFSTRKILYSANLSSDLNHYGNSY